MVVVPAVVLGVLVEDLPGAVAVPLDVVGLPVEAGVLVASGVGLAVLAGRVGLGGFVG